MQLNPVEDIYVQDEGLELLQQVPQHNSDPYKNSVQYLKDSVNDLENISSEIVNEQEKKINQPNMMQPYMDKQGINFILKQKYYNFFKKNNIIPDPQNYTPRLPSDEDFKKHKIKHLKGNQFHQKLHSYDQTYIRVKNTQRQGTIVNYIVIIGMFEQNFNQNANIQENKIGSGSFGSVRIQSQNKRMFAVKRQMFTNNSHLKQFNMMANKYQINQAITQLSIYKICSLLKIGPAAETQIGFDLICYKDCIEFHIQYCMKIEYNSKGDQKQGIFVDKSKFEKQIKQCLLTLHFYRIIHKDIKPANILFSIKYNKYVFTDFGISHPVLQKIGQLSITHLQGTQLYMSKQMRKIKQSQTGYVHLYGNDVHSISVTFLKKMINQNIEQGMKQFNQKIIKQYNKQYDYEYLKLKYYCTKPVSKMEQVQNFWKFMNINRRQQLLMQVDKSIEYEKIKSVYNYLSELQEFKEFDLESLRMQSQSIKNIKIYSSIKQITELYLNNVLRIYGYSQQVKEMIIKSKLQQKYKYTLGMIEKKINTNNKVNHRDMMFGNHMNYIKKIKNQILECQKKRNYREMFQKYMIILEYGNIEEQIQTIQKLNILNYKRNRKERIEQIIRLINIEKNKEKIIQFNSLMEMKDQQSNKIITQKNLDSYVAKIYDYISNYNKSLQYYTRSVNMMMLLYGQQHPSVADTYNNIANVYNKMGKYNTALQYYTKAITMQIQFYGQQHPSIADTYNSMAIVYDNMGKYEKALQYYTKSVKMQISFHGQQHPSVADTYNNIANLYENLGKYEKALKYYTMSGNMMIIFYKQRHPSVADTQNNIGNVYNKMGKYNTALQSFTKAITMQIQFYGQQHPSIADTYNNIAGVFDCIGKYQKALQYYTKSVNMKISIYGQQHPSIANTYNNIANVYYNMGNYVNALQSFTKAITMQIQFYGQQHPSIANTYNNIANVYYNMGNYVNALQSFTKAITMQIQFYGQQHPSIADTYNNIANVYDKMGKYNTALQSFTKAITMQIQFYGQQHPSIADTYNNIAGVFDCIGKYQKALQYYTKSVNMKISIYGQQHPSIANTYNNIANVYYNMGNYVNALQSFTKAITMQIQFYGQQHPSIADTYNNIANVYYNMGNYVNALQYFTKSVNMMIQFYGQQHPSIANTYNNIAVIYKKMGKYEEALQYFTKSVNMMIQFYGQQHPSIAGTYNNFSLIYASMGQYEKALQYFTKSVNMYISFYGQQHPSIADTYNNFGLVYVSMGKNEKALQYYTKSVNMDITFHGQQHPSVADTYNKIGNVYKNMRNYEKALQYYTKSVNITILFYGQRHPYVASAYHNISSTFYLFTYLTQSLKYCNKSIKIQSTLSLIQYPLMANNYHLLSCIFLKKLKYTKALHYEFCALDTLLKTSNLDNHKSPYYLLLLADIHFKKHTFIKSYFFYRLSWQILTKNIPIHQTDVQIAKDILKKIKKSIPSLIHNFKTNIQFMNNINSKYKKLSKHDLLKLLLAKKWELRFEEQHRNRRNKFQYLKCMIQIYLCYKYLGYTRQMKKVEGCMKEELLGLEQSQQKFMIGELIQVISNQ